MVFSSAYPGYAYQTVSGDGNVVMNYNVVSYPKTSRLQVRDLRTGRTKTLYTEKLSTNQAPALTRDGRAVLFTRYKTRLPRTSRPANPVLIRKDVKTGRERRLGRWLVIGASATGRFVGVKTVRVYLDRGVRFWRLKEGPTTGVLDTATRHISAGFASGAAQ